MSAELPKQTDSLFLEETDPKKFSWVMLLGSLVVPAITLIFFVYAFGLIDDVIGTHASRYHGYNFLVLLLYPAIMPATLIS